MVFVIGVDHLVQYNGPIPEPLRLEFKEYLVTCSHKYLIDLIAEEFSNEALNEVYHASKDTAREASEIIGIPHLFCDLEEHDMKMLGIPYFAEIHERVRALLGTHQPFILDDNLRNKMRAEAMVISKTFWRLRETFWYGKITPMIEKNILFICGHEHAVRFQSLLHSQGHACTILDSFWRGELFKDYKNIKLD
jgi:hypothetical protein